MMTKTTVKISILTYVTGLSLLCVNNVYYTSAWSSPSIGVLSSSSVLSSLPAPLSSSSKSSTLGTSYIPIYINNAFSTRRRHAGNRIIGNVQYFGRLRSRKTTGEVVTFASLDHDPDGKSSVSSLPSSSISSSLSSSDIDTVTDSSIRTSSRISEEDALPFMGVGRLYHNPTPESTYTPTPIDIIERLKKSTVAVIGIGGVGSWAAEALCRSGVGNILLIDLDDICVSNTNRQVHTTSQTVGRMKTEEMGRRLVEISPSCNVTIVHDFISVDNAYTIIEKLHPEIDIILDAIDGAIEKTALIAAACVHSIPIVTCGGAAGRTDPTQIVCDDLTKCADCRLLFSCRKRLRDEYRLFAKGPSEKGDIKKYRPRKWRIAAVFSTELRKKVGGDGGGGEFASSLRQCDGALGTACFVTGTYGFVAASKVVSMIVHEQLVTPRVLQSSVERIKRMHQERISVNEQGEEFNILDHSDM